jgi:hypothetical protein
LSTGYANQYDLPKPEELGSGWPKIFENSWFSGQYIRLVGVEVSPVHKCTAVWADWDAARLYNSKRGTNSYVHLRQLEQMALDHGVDLKNLFRGDPEKNMRRELKNGIAVEIDNEGKVDIARSPNLITALVAAGAVILAAGVAIIVIFFATRK